MAAYVLNSANKILARMALINANVGLNQITLGCDYYPIYLFCSHYNCLA
jgi:hypothetical protein